ncbi:hypothetical protein T265_09964 [Opisthorchis viverrini]|uniref:Uncharacterized protein n=1 Tax=Opisthorchis viverrini TaxID=6198 RepID=A0A075A315_OPIVI|nr:hypothetical protein T265_09964 [Opisthorchis viverrini]KER21779.1 hypothetical protein T265_09964 [Opisthorchis viverrini]
MQYLANTFTELPTKDGTEGPKFNASGQSERADRKTVGRPNSKACTNPIECKDQDFGERLRSTDGQRQLMGDARSLSLM